MEIDVLWGIVSMLSVLLLFLGGMSVVEWLVAYLDDVL